MGGLSEADTIRILVASDNHVGYKENDAIRGSDASKTFHEIMGLAKEQDVDMILLAGDLFHDNRPSRNSLFQVMRSLRMNCLGEKPCEVEFLGDGSEVFGGTFNSINYEDPDINVAIPVFSIHGNHDDPSGKSTLSALDVLQVSGLINYYGRTPESDNLEIKPVLLQKGRTKLALYGMSNVRDERLFRTFRDGHVKFYQPNLQKGDWFNLMSVHQNHHAHTQTGYLPENFLPDFIDLVIWGHEHECLIEPRFNPEMSFYVSQPGSSVATSLMPGEAVPKHIGLLSITGKDFKMEPILLKTVRPFLIKDIILSEERELKNVWKKTNNRSLVTDHLQKIVLNLINQAKKTWSEAQDEPTDPKDAPKPLIRLRVEYSAPDGGQFDCENPQRFSNRFVDHVANTDDVVQFYKKKSKAVRKVTDKPDMPDESVIAQLAFDQVKVEELVREFLTAQSLTILPQNSFGDSVSQFVDKDDRQAMETFVNESLASQVKYLLKSEENEEVDISEAMEIHRSKLEAMFAAGHVRKSNKTRKYRPRPENWDEEFDGTWEDQPGALIHTDAEDDEQDGKVVPAISRGTASRDRGRGRGRGGKASPKSGRSKRQIVEDEEDEDLESDDNMIIDDDGADDDGLFVKPSSRQPAQSAAKKSSNAAAASSSSKRAAMNQTTLDFSQHPTRAPSSRAAAAKSRAAIEISDDEISDDDDAFEPVPPPSRTTRSRR